jgi:hypothetical protein
MKKLFLILNLTVAFSAILFINSCKKDDDSTDETTPVQTERERIIAEYNINYLGSAVTDCGWTGNTTNCEAGTTSVDALNKTLQRINYFRKMVGLNYDITFDATKNAKCQEAALMMSANNSLSHTPPTTWSCYTADGATAAGSSNLSLGGHSSGAITMYMSDYGTSNYFVGHRRWILYSKAKVFGSGSTSGANALWVFGNSGNPLPANMPEFVAWPPKGYVPAPLVYSRWSLSVPAADFANATVVMTDAVNANITCSVVSKTDNGYGDNTIVWEPTGINTSSTSDVTYHVTINNVIVNSAAKNYTYDVILIKP